MVATPSNGVYIHHTVWYSDVVEVGDLLVLYVDVRQPHLGHEADVQF